MWRKIKNGFVNQTDDAFNIIVIQDSTSKEGAFQILRSEIRRDFAEYYNGIDIESSMEELRDEFEHFYEEKAQNDLELAYYCVDGWSVWSADTYIPELSKDDVTKYLDDNHIPRLEIIQ
jgi:hypothetical protein